MSRVYIANFGTKDKFNGQVQKSLQMKNLLDGLFSDMTYLDVSSGISSFVRAFKLCRHAQEIYLSLGQKGIQVILVIIALSRLFSREPSQRIKYFVVGGWIMELIRKSFFPKSLFRLIDEFFVESSQLAAELVAEGFKATVLPNFRSEVSREPKDLSSGSSTTFCFCSRIRRDKGVMATVRLVEKLNLNGVKSAVDFYGPIEPGFDAEFFELARLPFVSYKGKCPPEDVVDIIHGYDFLILPTFYEGECMPGAVIEAFCAATPVVVTNWRFLPEIVADGKTGFVSDVESFVDQSFAKIVRVMNAGYFELSRNAKEEYDRKYTKESAMKIVTSDLS